MTVISFATREKQLFAKQVEQEEREIAAAIDALAKVVERCPLVGWPEDVIARVWTVCFDLRCHQDPKTSRLDLYPERTTP
jgi:hypothetical protein